jgi:hypothetical protein
MATAYTSLLGFALPVTGELNGTWGDVVNSSITSLVESAIAGSATASVTSGNWTLTTTGSGAANQARAAILIPTGSPGVSRDIIAPASSKAYIVDNQSNASVVIKASATTGVSIASGTASLVAWDGIDFILVSQDLANASGVLAATKGGTGQSTYAVGDIVYASTTTALSKLADVATGNALISGGVGVAPSYGKIGLTTHVSGTLPVTNGGTGQTTYTDGQLLIGNTSGNTINKATLTSGTGITVTNGAGSITIAAINNGTVTSVAATVPSFLSVSGSPITTSGTLAISYSGTALPIANGGTGATSDSGARTNLGASTLGANLFTITNPSAVTFPRFNADNTVSSLDASTFRTAIGAGVGSVTSVGGTGTVNGITLTGTVTSSGSLTLGGTLSGISLTTQVTGTLPVANGGTGITSFGSGVATFLGTPSSANLASVVTDETGSGSLVFATAPTLSGPTINDGYTEEVFAVSGTTPALSPTNGSIQTWTLTGNSTPTSGTWAAGQSLTLMIDDGTAFTVNWTSISVVWKTDSGFAPTLNTTENTAITFWKVGTIVYGARVGNA